jgi:hypothetical protein
VHHLLGKGPGITVIAETLSLDRETARRYASADTAEQLLGGASRGRDTRLQSLITQGR